MDGLEDSPGRITIFRGEEKKSRMVVWLESGSTAKILKYIGKISILRFSGPAAAEEAFSVFQKNLAIFGDVLVPGRSLTK